MTEAVWSAENTNPSAIDDALRELLTEGHAEDAAVAPARVLNLVAVVDRDWRGEIENRLASVGRFHPSRSIVCAVEPRRRSMDAWATITWKGAEHAGEISVCEERVELTIG